MNSDMDIEDITSPHVVVLICDEDCDEYVGCPSEDGWAWCWSTDGFVHLGDECPHLIYERG